MMTEPSPNDDNFWFDEAQHQYHNGEIKRAEVAALVSIAESLKAFSMATVADMKKAP